MNLKDATMPELLSILLLLLQKPLNDSDRKTVVTLGEQRTFTRSEKVLISSLCNKYRLELQTADAVL